MVIMYRMGHLAFGISTTGYFEFERHNNIYDIDIRNLVLCLTFTKWVAIRLNKIGKY